MRTFDVIVIGVGAMGSAACHRLAEAGQRVLGLEQFSIPNTRGSSHGATRILRLGLHESARYVPLVLRSVELFRDLGQRAGVPLFHPVGSLDAGRPESAVFTGSLASCRECGIDHAVYDAAEASRRFPGLSLSPGMACVHQPGSGFVLPEATITAQVNLALALGAEIHGHETVVAIDPEGGRWNVTTSRGSYSADRVLVTTGAWIRKLLPACPVEAERTVLGWFAPRRSHGNFQPQNLPVWIVDDEERGHFYGFPCHGIPGFKLGRLRDVPSAAVDPDHLRAAPDEADEADMRQFVEKFFPDAAGPILSMETCFFENTPDRAPLIGPVPGAAGVWVIGGFSGHGFKYAPAIGEVARDLVLGRGSPFDLIPFSPGRFHP